MSESVEHSVTITTSDNPTVHQLGQWAEGESVPPYATVNVTRFVGPEADDATRWVTRFEW